MAHMIRKQVFITGDQNQRLKVLAAELCVAEAELIRAGIDMKLAAQDASADWRTALKSMSGAWAERDDLDELFASSRRARSERSKRRMKSRDES